MSMGLDKIRQKMADYLTGQGVNALIAWPQGERELLKETVIVVSLRGCQTGYAGFQDYLGEWYNPDFGRWEERYGKKVQMTFGLDLYARKESGEDGMEAAFDALALALSSGGPAGMEIQEFSCGETGYDQSGRLLKRAAQVVCGAYLYAVTESGGSFLDFEIKGDVNT